MKILWWSFINAMVFTRASLFYSANFMNELIQSSDNASKDYHVLVYPNLIKNKENYLSVHKTAAVPINDLRWSTILCSTKSEMHTSSQEDVLYFQPKSIASMIEILKIVLHYMTPRTRVWCSTLVFYWPAQILVKFWNESNARDIIYKNLIEQVVPVTNQSIEINLRMFFVFEITFPDNVSKNSFWELYFVNGYETSEGKLVIQEVPVLFDDDSSWQYERRGNLRKVVLTVLAQNKDDTQIELTWEENEKGERDLVGGIALEILQDFMYTLNFRATISEGDWITQHPNGTLRGITTEHFLNRSVDLAIGQTVPILKRAEIMDCIQQTSRNMLRAYVHQPPASAFRNIYTTPFGPRLWLALLGACLLILISVQFVSKTLSSIRKPIPIDNDNDDILVCDAFIWLVGLVTQQGWHESPNTFSLRGIFITASLTALVCYIAYAAQIVSVLSLENLPIQSLSDLFKSSLPIYVITESITISEFIKGLKTEEDVNFQFVPKNIGVYFTFNFPSGLLIYSHRFHEERLKQGFSDRLACTMIYSYPVTQVPMPSAMASQKDSPLREVFNHKVMQMRERGFITRYLQKRMSASGLDCLTPVTRYRAELGIDDILTPIMILFVGYTCCMLFFICERCIYLHKRKRIMKAFRLMYCS